jgi:Tfp pilus assembly protein PilO
VKKSDATVLAVVAAVALIVAFWFVVLGPKRSQASDLSSQVSDLQAQMSQQQQTVSLAQQAQSGFAASYHKLVVLGKAVPADSEQASLIVQLSSLAKRAGVSFQSLALNQDSGASAAPPAPVTPAPTTGTGTTSTTTTTSTTPTTSTTTSAGSATAVPTAAAPTEASVAALPLGASVGAAGLPVMPYGLTFTGGYFQISKFLHELDGLVHIGNGSVTVSGRLITVNGFNFAPPQSTTGATGSDGSLQATLSVTTYVVPPGQGITAGATPTEPTATTPSTAVPTAAPAPTATAAPTAAPAP